MAVRSRIVTLFSLLLLTMTAKYVQGQVEIEPESVIQAEGLEAVFECLIPGAFSHGWFVNGVDQSMLPSDITVIGATSGNPSILTIPARSQFNNSVVQCIGVILSTGMNEGVFSRNATLIFERVAINVVNGDESITITVTNNFTTDLTYQLDVTLNNSTVATVLDMSNQFEFQYSNHTVCDVFSFTVTPTTMEMEGNQSVPVAGFFTRAFGQQRGRYHLVSENGVDKLVTFTFTASNCTMFISYEVFSSIQAPINGSITDPSMFNDSLVFSLPTDQRGKYTVALTDVKNTELVFENIPITTFDVQSVFLSDDPEVGVKMSIEYAQNSRSPGALVCVLPRTNGGLDFLQMKLVAIPRNASNDISIPVPRGDYSFVVFDLEKENGNMPRMPTSRAADVKNITVAFDIEGTHSPTGPRRKDITVTMLSSKDVNVTCPQPLNCLVLVQSMTSLGKTHFAFINSSGVLHVTNLSVVDANSNTYVVVYSWGEEESVFDGTLSRIEQLATNTITPSSTSDTPTTSVPDNTNDFTIFGIIGGIIVLIILLALFICLLKNKEDLKNKVLSSYSLIMGFTSSSARETTVTVSIISTQQIHALYDVAHPDESMSPEDDNGPPPAYDVVHKEYMGEPEYETVEAAKASATFIQLDSTTVTTAFVVQDGTEMASLEPPPLPPPLIRAESESPSLPPPYDPAVDTEEPMESCVDAKQEKIDMLMEPIQEENGASLSVNDEVSLPTKQERSPQIDSPEDIAVQSDSSNQEATKLHYTEVQPKGFPAQPSVLDPTKVVYAQVDKKERKPVNQDVPTESFPLLATEPPPCDSAKDESEVPTDSCVDVDQERLEESLKALIEGTNEVQLPAELEKPEQEHVCNNIQDSHTSNTDKEETKIAAQNQHTEVQPKTCVQQTKVTDHTKVVYAQLDKKKLKPVDTNEQPPPLPPRAAPPPPPPTPESLMKYLNPICSKWEDLAKALNYDEDRVDEIFTNNENDYLRLHDFVDLYFRNVHYSHSWVEVERALRDMGEEVIAGQVRTENMQKSDVPQFSSLV